MKIDGDAVSNAAVLRSTVDVPLTRFLVPPFVYRVASGDPDNSALLARMADRSDGLVQMPPLASEVVDADGVAAVSAWIESLPAPEP